MNRNEFLISTGLSALVVVLLVLLVVVGKMAGSDQIALMKSQQEINQGQVALRNLQQLAVRTAQLSQQYQDQGLKDLLARQQISIGAPQQPAADGSAPSAPATTPTR